MLYVISINTNPLYLIGQGLRKAFAVSEVTWCIIEVCWRGSREISPTLILFEDQMSILVNL